VGCLAVSSTPSHADDSWPIGCRYSKCESRGEIALRERLDRARVEGDLSATADAAELAGYITTILTHVG